MSTNSSLLQIGTLEVLVVRKAIKNLHLSILPPDGRIRVSSPIRMKDDAIRTLIATRIPWIHKQQKKFAGQERQTPRQYVSGESHYFFGKRYRLEVVYVDARPQVTVKGNAKLVLQVRPRSTFKKREEVITEWYRKELQKVISPLIDKWQKKIGVRTSSWGIKRMKTRWGTCNQKATRIWLNLELAKKPPLCIEYVTVHELVHLIERKHNDRFVTLMSKHLPRWRSAKEELNHFLLSHERWGY